MISRVFLPFIFALSALISMPLYSQSQVKASQENVMASFIYSFTGYLSWPEERQGNEFKIIVLGDDQMLSPLQYIGSKRTVQGRIIVVKQVNSVAEIDTCDMLFIGSGATEVIEMLQLNQSLGPAVVITDCQDCLEKGIGINFVNEDDRIRFEINKSALESKNIRISSQLLKLAVKVI